MSSPAAKAEDNSREVLGATSHTPGPWFVEPTPVGGFYIGNDPSPFGPTIAETWNAGVFKDQQAANARLLSAAPELLGALQELVAIVRGECPRLLNEDSGGDAQLDIMIDAAIAKATGQ